LILNISETIISFVLVVIFVGAGYSVILRDYIAVVHPNVYIRLLAFLFILGMFFSVFSIPVSFISSYWLENRFGLSNQRFPGWVWEQVKAYLVGLVLLVPILLVFYYILRTYPDSWWFWMATILFLFSVFIGKIAPQIIFPLFYKFEPISDDKLLKRMNRLAEMGNFSLQGVYRFDMSKTTKKANAAFTGLGKTRRIKLGDTLLEEFSLDEIETVFAHEVGHYVYGHLVKGIVRGTLASYLGLFFAAYFYDLLIQSMQFEGVADLAALPLLSLILSIFSLISSPLNNMVSRKYERQADAFALEHSKNPKTFISSMQKLSKMNLSDNDPHPVVEFLFHSHPSIKSRILQAERYIKNTGK